MRPTRIHGMHSKQADVSCCQDINQPPAAAWNAGTCSDVQVGRGGGSGVDQQVGQPGALPVNARGQRLLGCAPALDCHEHNRLSTVAMVR